jgi:acyl-CoA reductase-like NAD-dependent aldehyde dehydrogenase
MPEAAVAVPARQRILDRAYELFSRRGVRGVGIDEVIMNASVAKATLYRHFKSKDELVRAFLQHREELWTKGWVEGQDCCARSRILVERSAYDRFLGLRVEAIKRVRVGDPEDDTTEMGPLISAEQREKVSSYVDGTVAYRGNTPDSNGFWFPPTLVEASNEDRVAREEVFGPVAAVIPFEDEADAVRIANDTPYGLSGSIWTENGARALRVARALETGVLSVNSNSSVRVTTPFGGFKQSGFGRELGMHALEGYSEIKNVFVSTD